MLARPERHHPANVRYNMAKKKTKGHVETAGESASHEMKDKKMKVKKTKKGK